MHITDRNGLAHWALYTADSGNELSAGWQATVTQARERAQAEADRLRRDVELMVVGASDGEVFEPVVPTVKRQKYTCEGPVRGACGKQHRTIDGALDCCLRDMRGCKRQGKGAYSDRSPVHTDGSALTDGEKAQIQEWEESP